MILHFPTDPTTKQPVEPPTVYVEGYGSRIYYDRADVVDRYLNAHAELARVALNEPDSKHLLRWAAKEYEA